MNTRIFRDKRAQTSGATVGGAALLTTGVAMAVAGTTLTQTNLPAGLVTAAVGLTLVFAGIYVTAKGIVTEAVTKTAKARAH